MAKGVLLELIWAPILPEIVEIFLVSLANSQKSGVNPALAKD